MQNVPRCAYFEIVFFFVVLTNDVGRDNSEVAKYKIRRITFQRYAGMREEKKHKSLIKVAGKSLKIGKEIWNNRYAGKD